MAISAPPGTLESLRFTNGFLTLPEAFYERVQPSGLPNARLVAAGAGAAGLIGLDPREFERFEFTQLASGNALVRGMEPFAALYGGHQFGVWAGQLGDGRAITLGEVRTERDEPWELQLKGAGKTRFSRFADGRAVLRSTIREFLASEAMDALGVPTTRALAMTAGDEPVLRESVESAAMVIRLAPTFVRFGSFEIFAARNEPEAIRTLADYTIARFFPGLGRDEDRYARFFGEVVERTARLMADWQSVGFMHGVMNTDNFSILGLTLDYGPYGFMEAYDPKHICNHTDQGGRYAYDQQPGIGLWNCYALANALTSLIDAKTLEAILAAYAPAFRAAYGERFRAKLGLASAHDGDDELLAELRALMAAGRSDFTRTYRMLAELRSPAEAAARNETDLARAHREAAFLALGGTADAAAWLDRYEQRLGSEPGSYPERASAMRAVNPRIVLRNHLAQEAIDASEAGDDAPVRALLAALRRPYDDVANVAAYDRLAPTDRPPVEVSCSS